MTESTWKLLANYRHALRYWCDRHGPRGGGGDYNREARKYAPRPEPQPKQFGLTDPFALREAGNVRAEEFKRFERKITHCPQL